VPLQSIGGVSLGQFYRAAHKAWGRAAGDGSECSRGGCIYDTNTHGNGIFNCAHGRVVEVFINIAGNGSKYAYKSRLTKLATASGIHLGSRFYEVQSAYPSGQTSTSLFSGPSYELTGPGNVAEYFEFAGRRLTARWRLIGIELQKGNGR
jgi:hypothetical protein